MHKCTLTHISIYFYIDIYIYMYTQVYTYPYTYVHACMPKSPKAAPTAVPPTYFLRPHTAGPHRACGQRRDLTGVGD